MAYTCFCSFEIIQTRLIYIHVWCVFVHVYHFEPIIHMEECKPLNILCVAGVVPLVVVRPVVQHGHGGHEVQELAGVDHPQVLARVPAAVTVTVIGLRKLATFCSHKGNSPLSVVAKVTHHFL